MPKVLAIAQHHGVWSEQTKYCGAAGPIAYTDNGEAWSVNASAGQVMDWRYKLDERTGCKECLQHIENAKRKEC